MFVCLFVLYGWQECWTDRSETQRKDGHWVGLGSDRSSSLKQKPICQVFGKIPYFLAVIHIVAAFHWGEKVGPFWVKVRNLTKSNF